MNPPCFPSAGLFSWRLPSLGRVPASRVPRLHRYYEGAKTSDDSRAKLMASPSPSALCPCFAPPTRGLFGGLARSFAVVLSGGLRGTIGSHRFPGDPSRGSALLSDPGPVLAPRVRTVRSMLSLPPTRQRPEQSYDFEAQSHGFTTRCLRFARPVARSHARLASGRSLAFSGGESNPLDRGERFQVALHLPSSFPEFALSQAGPTPAASF